MTKPAANSVTRSCGVAREGSFQAEERMFGLHILTVCCGRLEQEKSPLRAVTRLNHAVPQPFHAHDFLLLVLHAFALFTGP